MSACHHQPLRRQNLVSSSCLEVRLVVPSPSSGIHGYDECKLPEPSNRTERRTLNLHGLRLALGSRRVRTIHCGVGGARGRMLRPASFDCFSGSVPYEAFWNLQGRKLERFCSLARGDISNHTDFSSASKSGKNVRPVHARSL